WTSHQDSEVGDDQCTDQIAVEVARPRIVALGIPAASALIPLAFSDDVRYHEEPDASSASCNGVDRNRSSLPTCGKAFSPIAEDQDHEEMAWRLPDGGPPGDVRRPGASRPRRDRWESIG